VSGPVTIRAEAPLFDFSISPSGDELVGSLQDGRIRVWSVAGELRRSWPAGDPPSPFFLHLGNERLVTGGPGHAEVLDLTSGRRSASWKIPELVHAAAAADGSLVAGAAADGTVPLWKPDGTLVRTLSAPGLAEIVRVAVSPRGDRVAVSPTSADLHVFDVATGRRLQVLDLTMAGFALAFSPQGGTLAAGSADGRVTLWNVASGKLESDLRRFELGVEAIAFSPDGRRLASASVSRNPLSAEAEARVFELASGRMSATPLGVSRWNRIAFGPDGRPFTALIEAETVTLRELSS
jgi:WD40 repeat protein